MTAVERLSAQQDLERRARNEANLERWHCQVFGDEVGRQLAHGWRVEYSVALCGINNRSTAA